MTAWSGGFPSPNWHHHPQEGGGPARHSHENIEPGDVHSGGTFPEERTNIPAWARKFMNCYRSQTR